MYKFHLVIVSTAFGLSACGGGGETSNFTAIQTNFVTPSSSGVITTSLSPSLPGAIRNAQGDGAAYVVGVSPANDIGFVAQAGVIPGSVATRTLTTGRVSMTGNWELSGVTNISQSVNSIEGDPFTDSGTMTATVDFANNTLTARSPGGQFTVNGQISGNSLSGEVDYRTTGLTTSTASADLTGLVGDTEAVGAFQGVGGLSPRTMYAGGFVVSQ